MDEVYIEGKTYECRGDIKEIRRNGRRIFLWDQRSKSWRASVHDSAIDGLTEEVAKKCPGCTLRVVAGK